MPDAAGYVRRQAMTELTGEEDDLAAVVCLV
jgi:hypothetical protein